MIAKTPPPPYYAVIFTAIPSEIRSGYNEMAARMVELAKEQDGFLGYESADQEIEITVSYWRDTESILNWKNHAQHKIAQEMGKAEWYNGFKVRIALVERDYPIN